VIDSGAFAVSWTMNFIDIKENPFSISKYAVETESIRLYTQIEEKIVSFNPRPRKWSKAKLLFLGEWASLWMVEGVPDLSRS
jgi:hypothetical protein